jgi:hypothetical protein
MLLIGDKNTRVGNNKGTYIVGINGGVALNNNCKKN